MHTVVFVFGSLYCTSGVRLSLTEHYVVQQCIHAPRTSHMSRSGRMPQHGGDSPWKVLLKVLQTLHEQLDSNEVPKFLRRKLFLQLFSFINVQLFNQLLLRRECCSFANGEYVKQGLGQVRFALCNKLKC
jgi:myosin V